MNEKGVEVVPVIYDGLPKFKKGFFHVKLNKKNGLLDKQGKEVVPPIYDNAIYFDESGYAQVEINGLYGFVDKAGRQAVKPRFEKVYEFSEGLAAVQLNDQWGFVNTHDELVVPQCGYIDKAVRIVIPLKYDKVGDFDFMGSATVISNGETLTIDKRGEVVR